MDTIKFKHKLWRRKYYDKWLKNKVFKRKNRFTQKDIATRLGVEPATISKYELDMREPNIEAIKKLATIFNVSIDYLLGRTPDVFVDATDRIALYTTKLSQKYNVLGLVMTIDKDENCKIIDAIYQKNKDTYYTQLHLPRTVLTAGEYIDIMSRL